MKTHRLHYMKTEWLYRGENCQPKLAQALDNLFIDLRNAGAETVFDMPDFVEEAGVEVNDVLGLLEGRPEDQQAAAAEL